MACANHTAARTAPTSPRTWTVLLATTASWLGMYLHNIISLAGQDALSPETLLPTLIYLFLIGVYFTHRRQAALAGLCAWAWLHLTGGALLSVAPWINQSPKHLAAHVLYGILQLPLVFAVTPTARSNLRQARKSGNPS
jgi:hypothetical protein